jgi:hypothetical protein
MAAIRAIPSALGYFADASGTIYSDAFGEMRPLTPCQDASGYMRAKVARKSCRVHGLVAETFIGPRPNGAQVNHKDGNKRNNAVCNLEYVTASQNIQHAYDTGLKRSRRGAQNPNAKLSEAQRAQVKAAYFARAVGGRLPTGVAGEIASKYGVLPQQVRRIAKGDAA